MIAGRGIAVGRTETMVGLVVTRITISDLVCNESTEFPEYSDGSNGIQSVTAVLLSTYYLDDLAWHSASLAVVSSGEIL
jgi:hypothetical protein